MIGELLGYALLAILGTVILAAGFSFALYGLAHGWNWLAAKITGEKC
jgi:Flp pilus assembly pilin Flp